MTVSINLPPSAHNVTTIFVVTQSHPSDQPLAILNANDVGGTPQGLIFQILPTDGNSMLCLGHLTPTQSIQTRSCDELNNTILSIPPVSLQSHPSNQPLNVNEADQVSQVPLGLAQLTEGDFILPLGQSAHTLPVSQLQNRDHNPTDIIPPPSMHDNVRESNSRQLGLFESFRSSSSESDTISSLFHNEDQLTSFLEPDSFFSNDTNPQCEQKRFNTQTQIQTPEEATVVRRTKISRML
ncbi:hypothetical protein BGZ76_010954 [Entomortierella beljakovae]|nr:hypothetical protein BGZ76_010954 [Entomortierella beljakovae]